MNLLGQTIDAKSFQYPNHYQTFGERRRRRVYLAETQNWIENQVPQIALKFQSKEDITFIQSLKTYQQNESQAFAFPSGMIKIFDIFEWNQYLVIAMEAGSTDLYQYIKSNYTEQEAFQILQQLSHSVKFLHSNKLIHRDLKPENYIRVGDKFKLIDFGLVKQSQGRDTQVGTPLFQAPEIVNNQQYSTPVDIWSLGCVFFEVLTKQPLCLANNTQELLNLIKGHLNSPTILYTRVEQLIKNQILLKLIKDMIHPEPSRRPAIDEIQRQLNVLVFSNFNRKIINGIDNPTIPPQPHPNQINNQQQPFDYLQSQKEITLQIKEFKEIQKSQNNDLLTQLNQMFEKFERKIEEKLDTKFQLYSLKEQQDEQYQQLQNNLQQLSLLPQIQKNQENQQNNINQISEDCLEIKKLSSYVPKIFEVQNTTQSDLNQIITVCSEIKKDRNFIPEIQQQYEKLQNQIEQNYQELKQNCHIILNNQIKQNDSLNHSLNLTNQINQLCTEISTHSLNIPKMQVDQTFLQSEVKKILLICEEIKEVNFIFKIQQLEENIQNQFQRNQDQLSNLINQTKQQCQEMQQDQFKNFFEVQTQLQRQIAFQACQDIIIPNIQQNKKNYDELEIYIKQMSQEIKNDSHKIQNILELQAKLQSCVSQVAKTSQDSLQNLSKQLQTILEQLFKQQKVQIQQVKSNNGGSVSVGSNNNSSQQ